jgi:hypothetical protein
LSFRRTAGTFPDQRLLHEPREVDVTRHLLSFVLASTLILNALPAHAHDAYDDSQSHPLRIVAYFLNPIGFGLEWLVTRPLHFVASSPGLERIFGHVPHESPYGGYAPYEPHDPDVR